MKRGSAHTVHHFQVKHVKWVSLLLALRTITAPIKPISMVTLSGRGYDLFWKQGVSWGEKIALYEWTWCHNTSTCTSASSAPFFFFFCSRAHLLPQTDNSSITGRGAECPPPRDFWLGNFCCRIRKKEAMKKREKGWKLRRKEGKS